MSTPISRLCERESFRRRDAPCKPLFQVIPFVARLSFRFGLMCTVIPMLAAQVGIMRRIKILLFRATPLPGRARRAKLTAYVGPA
ncbi:MAG TPA: hypothetical protein VFU28_12185, partial [Vicinamibacterales bacterium]|nr:hypothetical protein [Vicinamibacterales bacterium]